VLVEPARVRDDGEEAVCVRGSLMATENAAGVGRPHLRARRRAHGKIPPEGIAPMRSFDRITSNPSRMKGQPCIRDLRLAVKRVLDGLATYPDRAEPLREYPELEEEDIRQALAYAAATLDDEVIELSSV